MKIIKTFIAAFFIIFSTVFFSISPTGEVSALTKDVLQIPVATPPVEIKTQEEIDEDENSEEVYDAKFNIKLLETGEFHGDEVKAQSGETWLGLFKKGDEFSLIESKIKVETVFDVITDDREKGEMTGKSVDVTGENKPVFLLKNADFLKQKKIKTLFYQDKNGEEFDDATIKNETNKTFKLNNVTYNLFVKSEKEQSGFIDETSKLVLSDGKTEQIIYAQKYCDDCGWMIYWIGDLDGDGKLDLYLDLVSHYNVSQKRLFLSSQAEKGSLVKEVANFINVGC